MILVPTVAVVHTLTPFDAMRLLVWVLWPCIPVIHRLAEALELIPEWHATLRLLGIKLEDEL